MRLTDEEIKDWFDRLAETRLFKLAVCNLVRTDKAKEQINAGTLEHLDVMLEAYVIAKEANKKGLKI